MADISIVISNVIAGTSATTRVATAGASITQGQPVYLDSAASNQAKPARANADAASRAVGIALNGATSGQPVTYVTKDDNFTFGGTSTAGTILCVSAATAGNIAPSADLTTGNYVTPIGTTISATKAKVNFGDIMQSRVAKA